MADKAEDFRGNTFVTIVGFLCFVVVSVVLFIAFANVPFGPQIATALTYTGFLYYFIFFKTKFGNGYSLLDPVVRQVFPRILKIHVAFLAALFALQTLAFWLKPVLPVFITAKDARQHSLFDLGLVALFVIAGGIQEWVSHRILDHSIALIRLIKLDMPTNA